jgi:hypothetical protein
MTYHFHYFYQPLQSLLKGKLQFIEKLSERKRGGIVPVKKFLLILLVICIFGGVFWIADYVKPELQVKLKTPNTTTSPKENEDPGKNIKDLTLTYFGDDQRYRLETTFRTAGQSPEGDVTFEGMEAVLRLDNQILQKFATPTGTINTVAGLVQLQGLVILTVGDYRLALNQVEMDLNQGLVLSKGTVSVAAKNYKLEAGEMSADFDFHTIHFKGRPRLTVTKGG